MAGRRIVWGTAAIGALLLYLFDNNGGTLALLLTIVLVPLASGGTLLLFKPALAAALEVDPAVERGEGAPCTLVLANRGVLPAALVDCRVEIKNELTGESGATALSVGIVGREAARTPIRVVVNHCGAVSICLAETLVRDPFGLFGRRLDCAAQARTVSRPVMRPMAITPVEELDRPGETDSFSTQRPGNDPSETFQIREYVPGDPVRRIHWKLTEKLDKPLVRDFGLPLEARLALVLEPAPVTWADTDRALDDLFSAGQALRDRALPCTVRWPSASGAEEVSPFLPEEWEELESRLLSSPLTPCVLRMEGLEAAP